MKDLITFLEKHYEIKRNGNIILIKGYLMTRTINTNDIISYSIIREEKAMILLKNGRFMCL